MPNSTLKTTLGAGSYSYFAIYNGNQNYNPTAASPPPGCEPFTIDKKTPTITTTVLDGTGTPVVGSVGIGTSIEDSSTLTNGATGFPFGGSGGDAATVTYEFFTTGDCTGSHTDQTVTVAADGSVPNSTLKTTLGAGSYSYFAIYSGNQNNYNATSSTPTAQTCEPFTISKNTPTITTDLKPGGTVEVGTLVHDTATLHGATADAGGTVTFRYYSSQANCQADTLGTNGTFVDTVNVLSGSVPNSPEIKLDTAQTVWWRALYSGDVNNVGTRSDCSSEPLAVVDAQISVTPSPKTNEVGDAHTFTVTVLKNDGSGGTQPTPATVGNVDVSVKDTNGAVSSTDFAASTCDDNQPSGDNLDDNGQCILVINSNTAGQVTLNATVNLTVGGVALVRTTDGVGANTNGGVKTYVDANISISPAAKTNKVGDAHTFTVTVLKNDGSGGAQPTPATVGNVDVTLTNSNGAASTIDAAASSCDDNQPSGDNLDDNGQCILVINSNTAGQVTAHATVNLVVGGVSLTRATGDGKAGDSADAVKTYVDVQISITPLVKTNKVGDAHTFTVTVLKNDGSGTPAPATAGHVAVSLTDTNGAVSSVDTAASSCDDSGSNLDGNGQCILVINSNTAGQVTAHAKVTLTVGGVDLVRETDGVGNNSADGVKTYVDANISITPLAATNQVGTAHTFTVTVMKNTGNGSFVPAAGETVTANVTPSNGATITSAGGAHPACVGIANSPSATTDANGRCTIVVNSSTPGKLTVNASTDLTIGGVSLTRATGDQNAGDSANGVKTYVDSYIVISPATATNNVTVDAHVHGAGAHQRRRRCRLRRVERPDGDVHAAVGLGRVLHRLGSAHVHDGDDRRRRGSVHDHHDVLGGRQRHDAGHDHGHRRRRLDDPHDRRDRARPREQRQRREDVGEAEHRDHEEPEVADVHPGRHRDVHDRRDEHGAGDPQQRQGHRRPLAELCEDERRHRGTRLHGSRCERHLHVHPRERAVELHEQRDGDRHTGRRRARRDGDRHGSGDGDPAASAAGGAEPRDRDHEEPEVPVDPDRTDGELHDHGHEHRQRDADERHGHRPARPRLQQDERSDRRARRDGTGCGRHLQLHARERPGQLHERGGRDRHAAERPERDGAGLGAGDRQRSVDAAEADAAEADADEALDRHRQGSEGADDRCGRHGDVQDHGHQHR